jgi:hypothetical protein
MLPESQITPMTRVQIARDLAMAQTLRAAAQPGRTVLLLAGRGHVDRQLGVPQHLPREFRTKSIGIGADKAPDAPDLIAFCALSHPRWPRATSCERPAGRVGWRFLQRIAAGACGEGARAVGRRCVSPATLGLAFTGKAVLLWQPAAFWHVTPVGAQHAPACKKTATAPLCAAKSSRTYKYIYSHCAPGSTRACRQCAFSRFQPFAVAASACVTGGTSH